MHTDNRCIISSLEKQSELDEIKMVYRTTNTTGAIVGGLYSLSHLKHVNVFEINFPLECKFCPAEFLPKLLRLNVGRVNVVSQTVPMFDD